MKTACELKLSCQCVITRFVSSAMISRIENPSTEISFHTAQHRARNVTFSLFFFSSAQPSMIASDTNIFLLVPHRCKIITRRSTCRQFNCCLCSKVDSIQRGKFVCRVTWRSFRTLENDNQHSKTLQAPHKAKPCLLPSHTKFTTRSPRSRFATAEIKKDER